MRNVRYLLLGLVVAVFAIGFAHKFLSPAPVSAAPNGPLLAGTVKSASGQKMSGVTVSAKAEGSTITTSVFTDEQGNYYFPPLAGGTYNVWAQADTFETARGNVALSATKHQDFVMKPMKDFERQLTGDQLLAALPEATPEDRRMKEIFHNNCTGCHQPNYILQNRFDVDGWTAMLELMKRVDAGGGFQGPNSKPYTIIDANEKELAAYLARARGPEATSMKFQIRPRPTGDAARAVFTEYDIPLAPDANTGTKYVTNDGSDWSVGTPSSLNGARGVHDVQVDFNGNFWFSYNFPNPNISLGRVDAKTGEVKTFKVDGLNGMAAFGHGITRDQDGMIWFNMSPGAPGTPGRIAKVDPNTQKIEVFTPPAGMVGPTPVAGTVDVDGKGKIWATTGPGAIRFDPVTKQFTPFESVTYNKPAGIGPFGGNTYGLAADADGNAWWAQMAIDKIGKSDIETGKSGEVVLPTVPSQLALASPEERKQYEDNLSLWNSATPGSQGPRRMGADKNGHVIWVCDWYGGNLAKIDTHTMKATIIPMPKPAIQQPYQAAVDSHHNVWMNMMNSDSVMKYDPESSKWTEFPLPTLGAETRYLSLLDKDGSLQITLAYPRTRKVARMTVRTKEEVQALKAQAQKQEQASAQ